MIVTSNRCLLAFCVALTMHVRTYVDFVGQIFVLLSVHGSLKKNRCPSLGLAHERTVIRGHAR